METKLYDLFRAPKPVAGDPDPTTTPTNPAEFLMRAPLAVISEFLQLRREAELRVVREVRTGLLCQLFDSRRYPGLVHVVTDAVGPRP